MDLECIICDLPINAANPACDAQEDICEACQRENEAEDDLEEMHLWRF